MLAEAEQVASGDGGARVAAAADAGGGADFGLNEFVGSGRRHRTSTASAPAPDTALSDVD
jgi:hypothetical protein